MLSLVTGSSKGIGYAIAEALLKEQHDVILQSRNKIDLIEVQKKFKLSYPNREIHICAADLSNEEGLNNCKAFLASLNAEVDILVNNAGVFLQGNILSEPQNQLAFLMDTNLYSAYHLSRYIAPQMKLRQKGYIFNMCSIASLQPYPNGSSYCISKFALLGFSRCLREELKQFGVKVISILPGATWSDSWKGAQISEDRIMQATDIAEIVISTLRMSASAVVEEIIIRPQKGDL